MKHLLYILTVILITASSCSTRITFVADFNNTNDRIWVGRDFWSIPLEDWKVESGRLYCIGTVPESRVNLLTHVLSPDPGSFDLSVKVFLENRGNNPGSAGLLIGMHDREDPSAKAACYFGERTRAGVSLEGYAFLNDARTDLPEGFDFSEFTISVKGNDNNIALDISDKNGLKTDRLSISVESLQGLVAVANNLNIGGDTKPGNSKFSFDNINLSGTKVTQIDENSFGPVLFTQFTLSRGILKLLAFLPPVGADDNKDVSLQLFNSGKWETVSTVEIEPDSRTALFRVENWDATSDTDYRIEYIERGKNGSETPGYFTGMIRRDPVDRPLRFGGLTCQFTSGFPYTPLVDNLTKLEPDILFFSGDQIYEPNGGYQIKRSPEDVAIVNYLGKYYMFGWAFRDLMRDTPTICTPDDHDVYHGNLWGQAGESMPEGRNTSDSPGFIQTVKMVNVVNRTQCAQLPDPFDPTPINQGMSVWYTDLNYGKVSFAIITDRIFKTAPEAVSDWEGRHDHMKEPREDLSFLDKPGVEMVGERQRTFLQHWIKDWEDVNMKVLLSQTVYANVATHHGGLFEYLYGDLDSGGWPKKDRDFVVNLMRKGAVFHINGDQHLSTLVQYGLDNYRDAGWSFNTPAICNFYVRWFLPDNMDIPVSDRPDHGYPNTGNYMDAFGNKSYVYAVGNPGTVIEDKSSRYNHAQIRASGFGFVTFDQTERTIQIDSWRFFADVESPNYIRDQFAGWPLTINQSDNLGMGAPFLLPEISVNKPDQLLHVINEKTGDTELIFRMKGMKIQPKLFRNGTFTLQVGEGLDLKEFKNLKTLPQVNNEKILVEL
jgi:hypothetical protein